MVERRLAIADEARLAAGRPPLACAFYTFVLPAHSRGEGEAWVAAEARALGTTPAGYIRWMRTTGLVATPDELPDAIAAYGRAGVTDVVLHGLLDGRDTPPRSADRFIPDFEARLHAAHPTARFAMIGGRYYGMDRDKRWERTKAWYDAMVYGTGFGTTPAGSAREALAAAYARGENDEFAKPTLIEGVDGTVRDNDVVIHFNFRADRARQLTHALVDRDFSHFDRGYVPPFPAVVTLTEYEGDLPVQVAYPPLVVASLAEVVSGLGWKQFHVAETEKYAHVTYFFNGGVEAA